MYVRMDIIYAGLDVVDGFWFNEGFFFSYIILVWWWDGPHGLSVYLMRMLRTGNRNEYVTV